MRMTKRLNFRMWRESDAGLLYSQDRGRGYAVYLNWKEPSSPDHAREIIRQRLQHSLCWMITFRDGSLAGCLEIRLQDHEIGFWISDSAKEGEYAQEILKTGEAHAFENLDLKELWSGFDPGDKRSEKLLADCGFLQDHWVIRENENREFRKTVMVCRKR